MFSFRHTVRRWELLVEISDSQEKKFAEVKESTLLLGSQKLSLPGSPCKFHLLPPGHTPGVCRYKLIAVAQLPSLNSREGLKSSSMVGNINMGYIFSISPNFCYK